MPERIAVSFQGADCLRIIPISKKLDRAEVKFHFFDELFTIRKFEKNEGTGGLVYYPRDYGKAEHEITYHNSNKLHQKPVLLPKNKSVEKRVPFSDEIINLFLNNLIVPIPICRITANTIPNKPFHKGKQHCNICLTENNNTTDVFIARKDYDFKKQADLFPMIVNFLFPITTIDYLIYGSGFGVEPIFNKMFESNSPIHSLESSLVGEYQFFYRTYKLVNNDPFRIYSKNEYRENNFIEFFDNIDYLDLLAITSIAYKLTPTNTTPPKAAYEYDLAVSSF
jgi:hypothetical protein